MERTYRTTESSTLAWVASQLSSSHEGRFEDWSAVITVPEGGTVEQGQVRVTVDVTTVKTPDEKLTIQLKSPQILDVESHPVAEFVSTKIAAIETGYEVAGELTLRGQTRPITFPATIEMTPLRIDAKAEFVLDRTNFGIAYEGTEGDPVRKEVVVRFDLTANAD